MATDKVILRNSSKAGEDLSAKQFYLVKLTESSTIVAATASGDITYPLLDAPKIEEEATYAIAGICKVVCAETIKQGQWVATTTEGKAQVAVAGQYIVGQALEKGESGQLISVALRSGAKA